MHAFQEENFNKSEQLQNQIQQLILQQDQQLR